MGHIAILKQFVRALTEQGLGAYPGNKYDIKYFFFRSKKTKDLKFHLKDEKTEVGTPMEAVVDGTDITKGTGTNEMSNEIEVNEDGIEKEEVITSVIYTATKKADALQSTRSLDIPSKLPDETSSTFPTISLKHIFRNRIHTCA